MKNIKTLQTIKIVILVVTFMLMSISWHSLPANAIYDITIEGDSTRFSTGESYPNNIKMAGYDAVSKNLYLNYDLVTTKTVAALEIATFQYYVDVFNDSSGALGNLGTYAVPQSVDGAAASQTKSVMDSGLTLSTDLPAAYRVVVTVKNVQVN